MSYKGDEAMLCQFGVRTCSACCWGHSSSRLKLWFLLRLHACLFPIVLGNQNGAPSLRRLLVYELVARGGVDLLLRGLLRVPWMGAKLKGYLTRHAVCPFLAFSDGTAVRVICLLHPSRWDQDVRREAAFQLLSDLECCEPGYICPAIERYRGLEPDGQKAFAGETEGADWYAYSRSVIAFARDEE